VSEGQQVHAGDVLMTLEEPRTRARYDAARAEVDRLREALRELREGPRAERIEAARQQLARARSAARNAEQEFARMRVVVEQGLLPRAEQDRARNARDEAAAGMRAAQAALDELLHGTRPEVLAQAEAALAAAEATAESVEIDLQRTRISAPRDGQVESLPFEVGDQVAIGTPLAWLLVGDAPYARVYVPQVLRLQARIGMEAQIRVQGDSRTYSGTLRTIRSEPSFTPYYALSGDDASHLSWLVEIELGPDAAALPVGMPLQAEFDSRPNP
jgi:HlyD family secretion protein